MIEQGDFAAASRALDAFSTEHPDDARAEDAAFLSIVALVRAGRSAEAAAAARRYLARFPTGFRRAEVATIASGNAPPAPQ
jgi:outer membrane protein assembly factor BamD (BamD/ComL family)